MTDLAYLGLSKPRKFIYKTTKGFRGLGKKAKGFFRNIPYAFKNLGSKIKSIFSVVGDAAFYGDWKTRLSFILFGFGNIARKQFLRGFLFLIYEIVFILYMIFFGGQYISKFGTLGTVESGKDDTGFVVVGDDSFNILLYSVLTILVIFCTIYVWYQSIKQAYSAQEMQEINKKLINGREDLAHLGDRYYHATLLALPMVGLVCFTIVPLIFMVFVSFTNYNALHVPPNQLFTWVGFDNFQTMLSGSGIGGGDNAKFTYTFWVVLGWTILWAILATFTNFIIGMIVAVVINKKGIKLKKLWRTILVTTIAVPQFVSLLLMSKMLQDNGIYNQLLMSIGLEPIRFLMDPTIAKVTVVVVNLWVGVPFTVLSCTGILLNIPEDLYEAARIDGANPYRMFVNITLPYMMFVMTPSLITTFVGNINNFNIIYLLTGGGPNLDPAMIYSAGQTDLLITWLYDLTVNEQSYDMASVIGILIFIICAVFSLIFYSRSKSLKNEEDFQ